ncbi:MAG: tRNA lysidine(34) synthetase TilS, partial [Bacteroidales bacterium]|nr:tRNA lysidine(34) synthetase TilS [Bacteroidales bacterium]
MQRNFAAAIEELKGLINEWSAFSADAPVLLLAVSGGVDSMCMADLFQSLEDRVPFAVAHCNFRLRGEESDGDEALVADWAREHSVPLHITSFDTEKYASDNGISIEMAARELRYGWFAQLCSQHGYKAVAVAHNANDNAETLLLNLLRGSGLKGVTGMSLTSPLPCAPGSAALLLRPLLKCTRKQIEGYAFAHKVRYREDRTNAMSEYKRNRLRNDVFPIFESINPSFIRTLNREASYFEDASGIVEDYCRAASEKIVSRSGDRLTVSLPALLAAPRWRYILYYILEPFGFNSAVLASLENLLLSERTISGKRFESQTHILFTEREHLRVEPSESPASVVPCAQVKDIMPVRCAGTYHFNGAAVTVEEVDWTPDMPLKQPEGTLLFDA